MNSPERNDRSEARGAVRSPETRYGSRPGNHYVMSGTWIIDRSSGPKQIGVVSRLTETHESGTVVILWYPDSINHVSAVVFRERLRSGQWEIDYSRSRVPGGAR